MTSEAAVLQKEGPRSVLSDVKLARPGMLAEVLRPEEKLATPQYENLIIFGSGPIMDRDTKERAEDVNTPIGQDDVNMWGKMSARAAAELKLAGIVKYITISGGKTGGAEFGSEASIMQDLILREYPTINPEDIRMEPDATNTLENFAYVLNKLDSETPYGSKPARPVALLGADFHVARIKNLAALYGVENATGFSAQAVLRLIAERTNDNAMLDHLDKLADVDTDLTSPESRIKWFLFNALSLNEKRSQDSKSGVSTAYNTFFEQQQGIERNPGITQRWAEENKWGAGLQEIPEYWVGYTGYIKNDARLNAVLDKVDLADLAKLGVDRTQPLDVVRAQLLEYTKPGKRIIPSEDWEKNPPAVKEKTI